MINFLFSKHGRTLIFLVLSFFFFSLVSGAVDLGTDYSNFKGVIIEQPEVSALTNVSMESVNRSDFWGNYYYGDYDMPTIETYAYNQSDGVGTPAGSNLQVQYNNDGSFGGANVCYNSTYDYLDIGCTGTPNFFEAGPDRVQLSTLGVFVITNDETDSTVNNAGTFVSVYGNDSVKFPFASGRRARGTHVSPSVVQSGDVLFRIGGAGYAGTSGSYGFPATNTGTIDIIADGTFTNSSFPTRIDLKTTASGSTTEATRLSIGNDGTLTHTMTSNTIEYGVDSANFLPYVQSKSATTGGLELFTKTGTGSEFSSLVMYGYGLPGNIANRHRIIVQWDATNSKYKIVTDNAGSQPAKALSIETSGNPNQMYLSTGEAVLLGGVSTAPHTESVYLLQTHKDQNAATGMSFRNTNAGSGSLISLYLESDQTDSFILSHASGRTIQRYGIPVGGFFEILENSATANGLMIGTGVNNKPIIFGNNNAERMRIAGDGKVQIGSPTSLNAKLFVNGSSQYEVLVNADVGNPDTSYSYRGDVKAQILYDLGGYIRLSVNQSNTGGTPLGNPQFTLNSTDATFYTQVSIPSLPSNVNTTSSIVPVYVESATGELVVVSSSEKYKTNITPITTTSCYSELKDHWKEYTRITNGQKEVGLIAEELDNILSPECKTRYIGYKRIPDTQCVDNPPIEVQKEVCDYRPVCEIRTREVKLYCKTYAENDMDCLDYETKKETYEYCNGIDKEPYNCRTITEVVEPEIPQTCTTTYSFDYNQPETIYYHNIEVDASVEVTNLMEKVAELDARLKVLEGSKI